MPDPYAQPDDVLDRWIGANTPDEALVALTIDDAATLIRFEFPDIDDRIDSEDAGGVPADQLKLVVVQVVLRYLRNPDNLRTQSTGPFGSTAAGEAPGGLVLTDDDRARLSGLPASSGTRAFSIDPTTGQEPGWLGGSLPDDCFTQVE